MDLGNNPFSSSSVRMYFSFMAQSLGGGNSNMFYFHPDPWGNDPNLTNMFQMG